MFKIEKLLTVVLCLIFSVSFVFAQDEPPATASSGVVKAFPQQSLANLAAGEKFSSVDGQFTIALPRSISGFTALTPQNTGGQASGSSYQWVVREGVVVVQHLNFKDSVVLKNEQDYVDFFGGARAGILKSLNASLISQAPVKLGNYRGYRFDFTLPSGQSGTSRTYWVAGMQYTLLAVYNPQIPNAEKHIAQAFDSLALISRETIDADLKRKIEEATPRPLPQTPVAAKPKSDAEDDNLIGKVKTVITESEDLSGTWSVQGRHNSWILNFNEQGNRTKEVRFDSQANPYAIEVYGYIDGARVSSSESISYSYDPPPMLSSAAPGAKAKAFAVPPLYQYRFEYKYADGRLTEEQMYTSDGSKGMRYVYNYQGNQVEKLVYTEEGKLNQKYLYILDDKGNEIERTDFDIFPTKLYGDRKYTEKYDSYDEKGNWTKQTTSKLVVENGTPIYKPSSITYRTINYYP